MVKSYLKYPTEGVPIETLEYGKINVPYNPIIPFIEGDGVGPEISQSMIKTINEVVKKTYTDERKITWMEIYAGEKANLIYGGDTWLPKETIDCINQYKIAIKGPLMTPTGPVRRSLNVSLRQQIDLYVCQRPIKWFSGVPSPVHSPEKVDMVVFRENSEDIYAGIEWEAESSGAKKIIKYLQDEMKVNQVLYTDECGIGIKPVSRKGSQRLIRAAIEYAIKNDRKSVTLVHKGNIMKFTEGAFRDWGYEIAINDFDATPLDGGPWHTVQNPISGKDIIIKDVIADAMLQQILTRPAEYDVIATLNLNGDYISDALAACVGGIGIAPGANINYISGIAIFEATHGTAPKYAGKDQVNPGSLILSGEMMLRYLGWTEAADLIIKGMNGAIGQKRVTYDFERLMENSTLLKCSEFGDAMIENM